MATTSVYPDALPTLTDVPATFAEIPKHSVQHNTANADIVAIATALGSKQAFKAVKDFANDAARDAWYTSPANGVPITNGNKFQIYFGGAWVTIGAKPVVVTSGATASTGWTVTSLHAQLNGTFLDATVTVTKSGSAKSVPATGDFSNEAVCILPASLRGTRTDTIPTHGGGLGRLAGGDFTPSTGEMRITAVAPGGDIAVGELVTLRFVGHVS